MWRRCIAYAYDPERLFERFRHQVDATYANRIGPAGERQADLGQPEVGAVLFAARLCASRDQSDYRRRSGGRPATRCAAARSTPCSAWRFIGHHLIEFTREALRGEQNASFYSTKKRAAPMAVAKPPAQQDEQVAA